MTATSFTPTEEILSRQDRGGLVVVETSWGCLVRTGAAQQTEVVLRGGAMRFLGACLILAAVGLWVLPGVLGGQDILGFRLVVSIFMAGGGFLLLSRGADMGTHEVHIDRDAKEIRHVLRMKSEKQVLVAQHGFEDVRAIMFKDGEDGTGVLFLGLKGRSEAFELATGEALAIDRLAQRICNDIGGVQVMRLPARVAAEEEKEEERQDTTVRA